MNPENETTVEGPESAAQSDKAKIDNRERLGEITAVLRKHHITRGVTPGKLRAILEELGPTYVKLGQIMSLHSDVLPQRYCDELMKLTSEVTPPRSRRRRSDRLLLRRCTVPNSSTERMSLSK